MKQLEKFCQGYFNKEGTDRQKTFLCKVLYTLLEIFAKSTRKTKQKYGHF
jgi:hypothetical protein